MVDITICYRWPVDENGCGGHSNMAMDSDGEQEARASSEKLATECSQREAAKSHSMVSARASGGTLDGT